MSNVQNVYEQTVNALKGSSFTLKPFVADEGRKKAMKGFICRDQIQETRLLHQTPARKTAILAATT